MQHRSHLLCPGQILFSRSLRNTNSTKLMTCVLPTQYCDWFGSFYVLCIGYPPVDVSPSVNFTTLESNGCHTCSLVRLDHDNLSIIFSNTKDQTRFQYKHLQHLGKMSEGRYSQKLPQKMSTVDMIRSGRMQMLFTNHRLAHPYIRRQGAKRQAAHDSKVNACGN